MRYPGTDVSDFRVALGLSQMMLALWLDVSQPQLHKLERGYVELSERHKERLEQLYSRFLQDVRTLRGGGNVADEPWTPAARFWASRPELHI